MSDNTPPVDPPDPSPYEAPDPPTPPLVDPALAGPPPASSGTDKVMLYGILGIVLAVVCCAPLGILFGYMSMQEARKQGKDETLGKVGFWIGIALTALGVIGVIVAVCAGGFGAFIDSTTN